MSLHRTLSVETTIVLSLRRAGDARNWTGHVMVNHRSICGEPVLKPRPISVFEFGSRPCGKCRDLLEEGTFGVKKDDSKEVKFTKSIPEELFT